MCASLADVRKPGTQGLIVRSTIVAAWVLSLLLPGTAFASDPGTADVSFSTDGVKFIDFGGYDSAEGVFFDSGDRLTVVGSSSWEDGQANVLGRLLIDGRLDLSFGKAGRKTFDLPANMFPAWEWQAADDGALIALGRLGQSRYYLTRFGVDGRIDRTFGRDGRITGRFGEGGEPGDMLILPAGRIVVAGTVGRETVLVAHNADGSRDRSFGIDGEARVGGHSFNLTYDPSGRFLLAGIRGNSRFVVDAFSMRGRRDTSFGQRGRASIEITHDEEALRSPLVGVAPDGSIFLVSDLREGLSSMDIVVAKLAADGTPEPNFGGARGWRRYDVGYFDVRTAVTVLPDGNVIVAGFILQDLFGHDHSEALLLGLRPDGNMWRAFGDEGVIRTDFGLERHVQARNVLLNDGRLVVVGNAKSSFFVARFLLD